MIKNKIFKISFILLLCISTYSDAKDEQLSTEQLLQLKKTVKVFSNRPVTLMDGIDKGSYYFLQLKVKKKRGMKIVNAFLEKESGDVVIGHRYTKNGEKVIFPKTAKSIETIKNGISFSYGTGKKELYLVTDPECPYCKQFEQKAQNKLDDYIVHVILYPLSFHKESPAMVEWIMQGKDDAQKHHRMEEIMVKNSTAYQKFMAKPKQVFKYTDSIRLQIDNAIKAAKVLGASGTPSVYNAAFNKINWKSLLKPKIKPFEKVTPKLQDSAGKLK